MTEFLTNGAWIIWLALTLIFVIVEVATVYLVFAMLAVGTSGGLLMSLIEKPFWSQVLVAGILSLFLLFVVRPLLRRALDRGSDNTPSNIEALIGQGGSVLKPFDDRSGQVQLANGETWTARLADSSPSTALTAGDRVIVTAIDGATAVVVPAERNQL